MKNPYLLATQSAAKTMRSILTILKEAETWAVDKAIPEETLLEARLAPDMLPFKKQIQVLSDNAKGFSSRFAGIEPPKYEDNEKTFQDLIDRIQRTIEFVESIPGDSFEKAEEQKIILPYFQGKYQEPSDYLRDYALANFYFHVVTAYGILRNQGMALGKSHYIGGMNLRDL